MVYRFHFRNSKYMFSSYLWGLGSEKIEWNTPIEAKKVFYIQFISANIWAGYLLLRLRLQGFLSMASFMMSLFALRKICTPSYLVKSLRPSVVMLSTIHRSEMNVFTCNVSILIGFFWYTCYEQHISSAQSKSFDYNGESNTCGSSVSVLIELLTEQLEMIYSATLQKSPFKILLEALEINKSKDMVTKIKTVYYQLILKNDEQKLH